MVLQHPHDRAGVFLVNDRCTIVTVSEEELFADKHYKNGPAANSMQRQKSRVLTKLYF